MYYATEPYILHKPHDYHFITLNRWRSKDNTNHSKLCACPRFESDDVYKKYGNIVNIICLDDMIVNKFIVHDSQSISIRTIDWHLIWIYFIHAFSQHDILYKAGKFLVYKIFGGANFFFTIMK